MHRISSEPSLKVKTFTVMLMQLQQHCANILFKQKIQIFAAMEQTECCVNCFLFLSTNLC